jgi:hypothetical protein
MGPVASPSGTMRDDGPTRPCLLLRVGQCADVAERE